MEKIRIIKEFREYAENLIFLENREKITCVFYTWKLKSTCKKVYTWIIYTFVRVLLRRIYTFCVIWLKQCFWRIYTSVRVFFNFFSWRIFTSVRVFSTLENHIYLPEEYTPVCECFLIFSFENLYLCASWQK